MHRLLPVLQRALADLGMAPEREASRVASRPLALEGAPALAMDGTERRRQRPQDAVRQHEYASGKKKTHTEKNLLRVHEMTGKVVSLGPTEPGKKHDKKAADEAQIAYPLNATLDKDTGLQGYEPPGVLTQQPKKNQRPGQEWRREVPSSPYFEWTCGRRKRHCWCETMPHCQRHLAPDHRGALRSRHGDCLRLTQPSGTLSSPAPHI